MRLSIVLPESKQSILSIVLRSRYHRLFQLVVANTRYYRLGFDGIDSLSMYKEHYIDLTSSPVVGITASYQLIQKEEENEQKQSVFKYCDRLLAIGRKVTSQRGRIRSACNYNAGYCLMPR
ncbi:hypothetical protein AVEN_13152-1 [Araneus ventricosus]|uniref:Uncharacterized protein n=1 Tax=Araneus ventricosus TaxID=182803 RepID=A0A4Y2JXM8_ARAVE|nr:hypothetical protein AVEN_13152-1 [Araneus ventricosus]